METASVIRTTTSPTITVLRSHCAYWVSLKRKR